VHFKKRKENRLHPTDEIVRLIEKVNMAPNVVGVINNGTSLESDWLPRFRRMWKRYSKKRIKNWQLFYNEIDKLNKEYYEVPGHHPLRKGTISHVSTNDSMTRVMPTEFGHEIPSPITKLAETDSPPDQKIGDFHCVFLNTGKDSFSKPRHWRRYAHKVMVGKRLSYDCEGIKTDDIERIHNLLEEGGRDTIYLFLHCPLINSSKNHVGKSYQLKIKSWLKSTTKQGLGHDVILEGADSLIDLISKHQKNVIIVSSHSFDSKYYIIDKNTLIAKEVDINEFNEELHNSIYIKHLNTPCLGSSRKGHKNGYISISQYKVMEIELKKSKTATVRTDINEIITDTGTLKKCLEKHRNLFAEFQRIVMKERQIFEDIKDELTQLEPQFKDNKSKTIVEKLAKRLSHSLKEYKNSHETEVDLLKKSLNSVQEEYNVYGETIPKIEAVFKELRVEAGVGPSADYDNVKNVFFEWYKTSIISVNELSHKIVYKETLFDNIEKKVINEIHSVVKDSKMTTKSKMTKLKKVKTKIDDLGKEIDSYFLSLGSGEDIQNITLYGVHEEAKKAVVFLDTVLRILTDFEKVFKEQSVKHK